MSKSFTLSKISLKDIVIAVLVLYITYKLVESIGFEPISRVVFLLSLHTFQSINALVLPLD